MLKFLRTKNIMKIMLWVVAGIIILSFGILSNAYLLQDQSGSKLKYAGKIFGKKISLDHFENNYQYTLIQARIQYGQNFLQVAQQLNLEGQTWERITLLEECRRRKIKTADKEVIETIRRYPFFHNQNTQKFDPKIYQMVLRQGFRITTRAFEEGVRGDLLIKQLFERETFTASVFDDEILDAYKQQNEKIRVSYVLFPSAMQIKNAHYDEIKAKNYFLEHKRDFRQPAAVNVFYLTFPFKPDHDASQDQAYEKARTVLADLKGGAELFDAAKNHHIEVEESGFFDLQKPGLSLGWPLEAFQSLSAMKPGQYSDIITAADNYTILQLRKTRPAFFPPYEQVKDDVKEAYLKEESMKLSQAAAENALTKFQNEEFAQTAQQLDLQVNTTPDFSFGQYLPIVGISDDFQRQAFSLTQEQPLSGTARTEKGYAILHLDERIPIDMETYEKEKDAFGQQLLMQKKRKIFMEFMASLREKANIEDLISELLKQ